MSPWVVWALLLGASGLHALNCTVEKMAMVKAVALGPIELKALLLAETACFQVSLLTTTASWIAVAIAATPAMVNSPVTSATVFDGASGLLRLYDLGGYEVNQVLLQDDQSSIAVIATSVVHGHLSFVFERSMRARLSTDVPIMRGKPTTIVWAYGDRAWPSHHADRGASLITITDGGGSGSGVTSSFVSSYTLLIVASSCLIIVGLAIAGTSFNPPRAARALCRPPVPGHPAPLHRVLADATRGEVVVVVVYMGTLAVVSAYVVKQFGSVTAMRRVALVSGHVALTSLMFLLLPVARGYHWELIFGVSHDRVHKFHRWLGGVVVAASTLHLIANVQRGVDVASTKQYGTQGVVPLYGMLAFACFVSLGLLGAIQSLRREAYELFYYHHRVFSAVALVLVILHSSVVAGALAFPLVIYGCSLVQRWRAHCTGLEAIVHLPSKSARCRSVVLLLPFSPTAKAYAASINAGAYFYVQVPSVSRLEWHPFSAVVAPEGGSIGFCMKAPTGGSFVDRVCLLAEQTRALRVRLEGPYGKIGFDLDAYDVVILLAGGIGITPLLNIINLHRHRRKVQPATQLMLHWIVKEPHDLLCADRLMFPLPLDVLAHFYVTQAHSNGIIESATGVSVTFEAKRPAVEDLLTLDPFADRRVAVIVCGPAALVDDAQYHAFIRGFDLHKELFCLWLLLSALPFAATAATSSVCDSVAFADAPVIALGRSPMTIKSLVQGTDVCFQVTLADATAKWVSLSVASTPKMVHNPPENVVVYDITTPPAMLFTMHGYGHHDTRLNNDQTPIVVTSSSSVNGVAQFTFQRKLAAVVASDVAIDPNGVTILTWAYGSEDFPSTHSACGAAELTLNSVTNANAPLDTLYTAVIGAGVLGTMLLLGVVATHLGRFRFFNHMTLCAPPKSDKGVSFVLQILADLKVGELVIVLCFVGALVGASLYLQTPTPILNYAQFSFVSGHLATLSLVFSLLPIARGPHWHFLFGISHDRILKFHRGSSRGAIIFGLLHLFLNLKFTSPTSTQVYGQTEVIPLAGLVALGCFVLLGIVGYEPIRRRFYAYFYLHHRVFSLIGLVAIMLHSAVVRYMMVLPLVLYGLSGVLRVRAFCNKYAARVEISSTNVVTITLPSSAQTKQWATTMNPGAFFYVHVPSVSAVEWHPFSAIATPDGESIAFCIKSMTKGRFTDAVHEKALSLSTMSLPVVVGGPYGKLSVDLSRYDVVLMVAGGIGITPMLSTVNQLLSRTQKVDAKLHLFWTVRTATELLCADRLMFPLPTALHHRFYVSNATAEGTVMSETSGPVPYFAGRPVLDELVNNIGFVGKSVCVLACGPPSLVRDSQDHARRCGFDFHKEEFLF
ncbi:transmembrane protein [Achlya hypogyna]|uniref:Transmembrane protein n=1 Tax=Achlya hypogyna TaxID=1202772 RepID=A0A1V9YFS5_ACHHY|nr:transmembrane protein [Achlya hypogyna]